MAGGKLEVHSDKTCTAPGFWEQVGQALHLTDSSCNKAVEAMKPKATGNDAEQLPNLFIEGIEAAKRQHRSGSINKQEAQMLEEI